MSSSGGPAALFTDDQPRRVDARVQRARSSAGQRVGGAIVVLLAFAALIALRMPSIVLHGRFWAEEGAVFFHRAWTMHAREALWAPYGGYLNLVANAGALLACHLSPLALAPYVTITVGLAFQLIPLLTLLSAREPWLRPLWARTLAAATLVLMPASEEVWLQTLHAQFQLAIASGIVLGLAVDTGLRAWLRRGVLCLGPLCGPASMALVPLFIARAARERTAERIRQAAIISCATLVQFTAFFSRPTGRAYLLDPIILLTTAAVRHIVIPFLGINPAQHIGAAWRHAIETGHVPWSAVLAAVIVTACIIAALHQSRFEGAGVWFFAGAVAIGALSYYGVIGDKLGLLDPWANQRYAVAPQSLIALTVVWLARASPGWTAWIARFALLWLLGIGVANYRAVSPYMMTGPRWAGEVAAWQADPARPLQLWPRGWSVSLPARSR